MRIVSIADAKTHLSEMIEQAEAGDEVCITRRGRPVARLTAVKGKGRPIDVEALRALTSTMPTQKESAGAFMRRLPRPGPLLTAYLDTSLLVAATTAESRTGAVQRWLAGKPSGELAISDWTITEYSAALSIKLREKSIDPAHRGNAMRRSFGCIRRALRSCPCRRATTAPPRALPINLRLACGPAMLFTSPLRQSTARTLYTLDKRLFGAAREAGRAHRAALRQHLDLLRIGELDLGPLNDCTMPRTRSVLPA